MTPLNLAGVTETLAVVWIAALLFAISMRVMAWYKGKRHRRPLLSGLAEFLAFGSLLTVFGIAQKANVLGLISYPLSLVIYLAAALAAVATGWMAHLGSLPEA